MKIFDPTAAPRRTVVRLAPRPVELAGLRLGLVENTKFNADVLLSKLAERLAGTYGMTTSVVHRKRSPSHEVDDAAIATLRQQVDLVISGIGD